jgi:pimeloyl-ACP methyl ester carboxylesterase
MTHVEISDRAGSRTHELPLPEGTLLVREWGPTEGFPVIHHHGLPECSLHVPGGWQSVDDADIRLVTFDRPGYGRSTPQRSPRVVEAASWTQQIADALGLGTFSLLGRGAGAPYAAAAASALGERVHKLCLANGLGPDELPGFDPASDMIAETRQEIAAARAGEVSLRAFLIAAMERSGPLEPWLDHLAPADVELLGRREVQQEEAAAQTEAMRCGVEGWVADDLALFHNDWGCDFSFVTAQTLLVNGLDDVFVPASHGDAWQLALGHGQLVKLPEAGHWLRDYERDVLDWLATPGDEPARLST